MALSIKNSGVLRQLALRLRETPKRIQRDAATEIKHRVAELIDAGIAAARDPYGTPYPQPKDGHSPPMQRSGDLRSGYSVEVVSVGAGLSLRISNVEAYARWLQQGTASMKARLQVPTAARGLPTAWRRAFEEAYRNAVERWYASVRL